MKLLSIVTFPLSTLFRKVTLRQLALGTVGLVVLFLVLSRVTLVDWGGHDTQRQIVTKMEELNDEDKKQRQKTAQAICQGFMLTSPEHFVSTCNRVVAKYRQVLSPHKSVGGRSLPQQTNAHEDSNDLPLSYCTPDVTFKEDILADVTTQHTASETKKRLVVIVAGEPGKQNVDGLVKLFIADSAIILIHYDLSDWFGFSWYKDVMSFRFPGRPKYWYTKRLLHPSLVSPYDFVYLVDEDARMSKDSFSPSEFDAAMKSLDVDIAQPTIVGRTISKAYESKKITGGKASKTQGYWTTTPISGPLTVFSGEIYRKCIWPIVLQEDVTHGPHYSLFWHHICEEHGFSSSAVLTSFRVGSDETIVAERAKIIPQLTPAIRKEQFRLMNDRFPGYHPDLSSVTADDIVGRGVN